jgi:hypothetical protein
VSYPNAENLRRNLHGTLYDKEGDPIDCDTEDCEGQAVASVPVSCNAAHDGFRRLCSICHSAYLTGVQHGRFHEAANHGTVLGRDPYLDKPKPKKSQDPMAAALLKACRAARPDLVKWSNCPSYNGDYLKSLRLLDAAVARAGTQTPSRTSR